jgi:hypothetical protein
MAESEESGRDDAVDRGRSGEDQTAWHMFVQSRGIMLAV